MIAHPFQASVTVFPRVYEELRRIARRYLRGQFGHHSLQPTALVNEAYLRLVDSHGATWRDDTQYLAVAARAMRCILVDEARRRHAQKRGGGWHRMPVDSCEARLPTHRVDYLGLDECLSKLSDVHPRQARVVELRFFGGLSVAETAEVMGISTATVKRSWRMAREWLRRELEGSDGDPDDRGSREAGGVNRQVPRPTCR